MIQRTGASRGLHVTKLHVTKLPSYLANGIEARQHCLCFLNHDMLVSERPEHLCVARQQTSSL